MAKSLRLFCGPGLLLVLCAAPPARAQQSNPDSLFPASNSVSLGAIQERRPGRLVQEAINRHREFINRAFADRHGTPPPEEVEPRFFETVIADVLNLVLERIQLLLFGSQLLDSLDGLFAPDDTSDETLRARASDSPNDDALLDAFRARTSAR